MPSEGPAEAEKAAGPEWVSLLAWMLHRSEIVEPGAASGPPTIRPDQRVMVASWEISHEHVLPTGGPEASARAGSRTVVVTRNRQATRFIGSLLVRRAVPQ